MVFVLSSKIVVDRKKEGLIKADVSSVIMGIKDFGKDVKK
jgi:hypothetical protein